MCNNASNAICTKPENTPHIYVYKVQTIGDAYIAVTGMFGLDSGLDSDESDGGGLSSRRHTENALALVNFALAMLEEIAKVEPPNERCDRLNMRLGVHVGRVVTGVIGTKKLRYDIWGSDAFV